MINNRTFKKINSIFWSVLSFLPVITYLIVLFGYKMNIQMDIANDSYQVSDSVLYKPFELFGVTFSEEQSALYGNPITPYLQEFVSLFGDDYVYSRMECSALINVCGWFAWVQLMRLITYVFYWFIDLITSLFDYLSFNKRGDN